MPVFSFVVARFVPDLVKNEPVNVGIVVRDSETGDTDGRFIDDFRALSKRHPESNIGALKEVLGSFSADVGTPENYLDEICRNNAYQLQFTEPRAVQSDRVADAVETLYARYLGTSRDPQRNPMTKTRLVGVIKTEIGRSGFRDGCVKVRPRIDGRIGSFTFDYGFQNGNMSDLMHSISFAGNASTACRDAKALAVSFEDVSAANDGLECTAVMHPPDDKKDRSEFYVPAQGYLEDKKCRVVDERRIRQRLLQIREKIGGQTRRR